MAHLDEGFYSAKSLFVGWLGVATLGRVKIVQHLRAVKENTVRQMLGVSGRATPLVEESAPHNPLELVLYWLHPGGHVPPRSPPPWLSSYAQRLPPRFFSPTS